MKILFYFYFIKASSNLMHQMKMNNVQRFSSDDTAFSLNSNHNYNSSNFNSFFSTKSLTSGNSNSVNSILGTTAATGGSLQQASTVIRRNSIVAKDSSFQRTNK
jgi:hypothetical protein